MKRKHLVTIKSSSGFKCEEIDLLEIAAHFFLLELGKIRKIESINVAIDIVSEIRSESCNEPLNGDMEEIWVKGIDGTEERYYSCRLADYANSAETMRTLAHELTHVWQTVNGDLSTKTGEWVWLGTSYGNAPYTGTDADYDLPWEVEADTLDSVLVKKFYKIYFN